MEQQLFLDLAGALAMAARFDGPAAVTAGAMPVPNIEAATALFDELFGARKPFGLNGLRLQTGRAAVFASSPDKLRAPWRKIDDVLGWANQTATALQPHLPNLLQHNPGIINAWALWAYQVSLALDELQEVARAEIEAVGLPGRMQTVEQFARHANVSPSTIYKNLDAPDAARRPPAVRIGGTIRFPSSPHQPALPSPSLSLSQMQSSSPIHAIDTVPQPTSTSSTSSQPPPTKPRRPHKPAGSNRIPGTGSKLPW